MNPGLIRKAVRESLAMTMAIGLGLFGIEVLFARILPTFYKEMADNILRLPLVRKLIAAGLGMEAGAEMGPATMMAMVWTHPVVLALIWTHAIWAGTRVPSAEIDRGTIDVLLSLPVSRSLIFGSEAVASTLCAIFIITLGLFGNVIGGWPLDLQTVGTMAQRIWVCANLGALYVAVFGFACFASSLSDRRGRATGVAVAFVIIAFVINVLSAFSEPIKRMSFLSLLDYYRPLYVLQGGFVPLRDIIVLLAVGLLSWIVGAMTFSYRDIRTV